MKILTLNTHSLMELKQKEKIKAVASFIASNDIDIIALQEVNQTLLSQKVEAPMHYLGKAQLKKDNYALALVHELLHLGKNYYWYWMPVKLSCGYLEEGSAILSKAKIEDVQELVLSHTHHYLNWKKRMALGIYVQGIWYYCVHLGWWDDRSEPFLHQWERLHRHTHHLDEVYLMGDFNAPDVLEKQSYDTMVNDGWFDCFKMCLHPLGVDTVQGRIIGWSTSKLSSMRLDYILSNKKRNIKYFEVVFDGKKTLKVSDHFGIYMEVE